ncbi:MAG: ABC transporter ATP-binding protein [Streptosporangiales bacterium]|nr:ABC transporter ATP-binding protein [Streptosporangiales bacterium]MBO0891543.1 ABC transporter ATP-binding protein [Acidothermales bacterium]
MSLRTNALAVAYDGKQVLHGMDFRVAEGEWCGLIGPNGAGKSTLLRAIAGLVPYTGDVAVADAAVATLDRRRLSQLVAYVPQRPTTPADMTVTEYVLLGRTPYVPYLGVEGAHDVTVARGVLARLDLAAFAHRGLGSLSGGELQRVVLGRALAQEAPVLLLDEPTSELDVGHQQQVLDLVDELRVERGITVVSAMHDLTLASEYARRLVLLHDGRAVATGTPAEVLTEANVSRFYDATVRVLRGDDGAVVVVPVRAERRAGGDG